MRAVWETIVILLCLTGLAGAAAVLFSRLLLPGSGREAWVILWAEGRGEELEQRVRGAMFLQDWGLQRGRVLLVDAGLDPDGRALAARLA